LSDCSSGTTITAKRPKLIALANRRSIAVNTSRSFGPTKNFNAPLFSLGSMVYDSSSRVGGLDPRAVEPTRSET